MRYRTRIRLLALAALALTLLAGCGSIPVCRGTTPSPPPHASATSTPQPPIPTAVRIVRFAPHEDRVAPFAAQTADATTVQQLFATLRALPPFVLRPWCPNDRGGGYLLTFLAHGRIVAQAVLNAGGCPLVGMSNPYGCHTPTNMTWSQVAGTFGVSLATLQTFYDTATPGAPIAPEDPGVPLLPSTPCGAGS